MEFAHAPEGSGYDAATGLPEDPSYLERALPAYLQRSIQQMAASWARLDRGEPDFHWDLNWNELNADLNAATVEQEISVEQAWYLREKYLRVAREDCE